MEIADQAWLETSSGDRLPLSGTCSLGRSPENSVVLPTEKMSRRHAVIHAQNQAEFWLVDLGSLARHPFKIRGLVQKKVVELERGGPAGYCWIRDLELEMEVSA